MEAAQRHIQRTGELQMMIWRQARDAASGEGQGWRAMLVMPALNTVFDIGTSRVVARMVYVPVAIMGMSFALVLLASLFVGYGGTAGQASPRAAAARFR